MDDDDDDAVLAAAAAAAAAAAPAQKHPQRPAPIPVDVGWNARVAAARRMTTAFCEPQHLALEEVTWHAATTLAREVLVRAESVDEDREPLPFHPELETERVQQLARAILAYDPFPDGPQSDEVAHPVQTLNLKALAEHLGTAAQGGLDGLKDIVLPPASHDDRLRGLLLDPRKSTDFPFEAGHKLRHVQMLSVEGIQLVALPADLARMKHLTSLQASRNRLLSLDEAICSLKQLTQVGLSHNYIRALPGQIGQLKKLTTLRMHCNRLAKLPLSLQDIDSLTELTLYGNELKIDALPISRKAALIALSLSDNKFPSMPELVDPTTSLELAEVRLDRNALTDFPKVSLLTNVTQLCLSSNKLVTVPTEIGQLTKLWLLVLDDNQLTALPAAIGQLKDLRTLGLAGNLLATIPKEISKLVRLTELRLDSNSLKVLPDEIVALSRLSHLTAARNEIVTLPQRIGGLGKLRALDLSRNRLTDLPDDIGSLKKLTRLWVPHNELTELPDAIANCKALVSLSVHDNQLRTLPANLPTKLTEVLFHNNPVMVEFSTAEIKTLFSAVTVEEGPGNVTREGLTSFINELTTEEDTEKAASRIATEIEGDQISVTIYDQGKLGLNFGADGGNAWPFVESIATDGLLAHCRELLEGMPLRVVGVNGQNGTQDMSKLSLAEATRVLHTVGLPMTLVFAKAQIEAHTEPSVIKQTGPTSMTARTTPRGRQRSQRSSRSPRHRSPRKLLPETDETIALTRKLKMTAPEEICKQLSDSSVDFTDVRDVFRDPLSTLSSDVSRWLTPCPSTQDLSQQDENTSSTRPSTQHYFTQDATAARNAESPRRLRAGEGWHMDAAQRDGDRSRRRPGSGAISRCLPVGVGYQNSMVNASKQGIPGASKYGISNFVVVPSCTVRELLLELPGGSSLVNGMEDSDLDKPLLQNTAQAIRVAHVHELSSDPSSTHPEDLAASSIILQSSPESGRGKHSLVMSSSRGVLRSRWTRWSGFEPSEQVLTLLTKVSRSDLIIGLTQARVELLLEKSQMSPSAAWLFEFTASERFRRKMAQLKGLSVEDITLVQGPFRVLADDERDFEEHSWVAQVQLLGGRLTWANVPTTSTGKAPTRLDFFEHWFKGGDVPYLESTNCVFEQIVGPMIFDSEDKTLISSQKRSICELLFRNNTNAVRQGQIGQANVFVSHSAANRWSVLTGAIKEYCVTNKLHPSEVFCWLDALSLVSNPSMDQAAVHKTYTKILRECGHTLAVMSPTTGTSPYAHPQWLSRAWCISEGYETVAAGLQLTVGLTAEETAEVRRLLRSSKMRRPFLQAMTTADIHRAKAFENKALVFDLVTAVPEGGKTINCQVSKSLRQWCMEVFDKDVELLSRMYRCRRDMKSLAQAQLKLCDFLALPGITSCEQLDPPGDSDKDTGGSIDQRLKLESAIWKGLECGSSTQLVNVFDIVVNGLQNNDSVELLSHIAKKASGTAARGRRKKLSPSGFIEHVEDLQESIEEWNDKGKAWQNTRKQKERDAARAEDVELKRCLHLVTVIAVEIDLQCARLASVIQDLSHITDAAERAILLFMYDRDRDAAQNKRLAAMLAAADTPKTDSSLWHRSEAFRRHKRHGAVEELAQLHEHQESERQALDEAQTKARLLLATPMRPDQREEAKAALAALEKDEPWMDDGTPSGRRWESEATKVSKLEAVVLRISKVTADAAQEFASADKALEETKRKLQAEQRTQTEIAEDCKALA